MFFKFTIFLIHKYIYLSKRVEFINGNEVEYLTSMEIPTIVTSLDDCCFYGCYKLNKLIIPELVKHIPHFTFMRLPNLVNLIIKSDKFVLQCDRIFYVHNDTLYSIALPKSLKKVNDDEIE